MNCRCWIDSPDDHEGIADSTIVPAEILPTCLDTYTGATVQNTSSNLVLTVPITPKSAMIRVNKLFQRTLDTLNRDSGFQQTGSRTVN